VTNTYIHPPIDSEFAGFVEQLTEGLQNFQQTIEHYIEQLEQGCML
jgi:hypothetical protein